jgi:S1-C subfamily serine protease
MKKLAYIFGIVLFFSGCATRSHIINVSYDPTDYPPQFFSQKDKRPVLHIEPVVDKREFAEFENAGAIKNGRFKEDPTLIYQLDDVFVPGPLNYEVRTSRDPSKIVSEALKMEVHRFGIKTTKDRSLADGVLKASIEKFKYRVYRGIMATLVKINLKLHRMEFEDPVWSGTLIGKGKEETLNILFNKSIKKWHSYPGFQEALVSLAGNVTSPSSPQPVAPQPSVKQQVVSGGTGFLFSSRDYIITNYHVVKGASSIQVKFPGGERIEASVQAKDSQNDIAVLKLSQSPSTPIPDLKFGDSSKVRPGDKVFTIGYPASSILGKNQKITDGIISSVTGIEDDPTMFQITVPIQPGNSGGPLFNERGEVIGITTASLSLNAIQSLGAVPQNINYAIKSSFVNNLLTTIPKTLLSNRGIVVVPNKPGNSLSDFFERVSNNIVLIEAKE